MQIVLTDWISLFCRLYRVKRALLSAVETERFNVDCRRGYDVGLVLCVKVIEIRLVLEVVSINLAAVNNIVRLNIVGELFDVKRNVFLCENLFCNFKDFRVRSRAMLQL